MSATLSQRTAYGETLVELGRSNLNIVVLEADLGKSTMSNMFQQVFPERYFEMGIAEQNMLSTAAGLAAGGKTAFVSSFAVFAGGRAYDQIRQSIAIGKLNVKICGSSSGLSDFGDGATHQCIEDIAIMSAIPNMTVLTPCDGEETRQAVRKAAEIDGPVYIRVMRNNLPAYTKAGEAFVLDEPPVLREGWDVALLAHGTMVGAAMEAAEELKEKGISAKVINVHTMKPFPGSRLRKLCEGVRGVVTAEEHTYIGGLASNTALALRNMNMPMEYVAIDDCFGQSAHNPQQLLDYYGLNAEHIVLSVNRVLAKRGWT